jgi:N-acetylglucosamine kinase-like BadF-type ATPase
MMATIMHATHSALYLGVDGGGTKTLAVIVDADGRERGRGAAGSGNQSAVGIQRAIANITQAVTGAATEAGAMGPCAVGWVGLAGVDRPDDRTLMLSHLASLATSVHVTNDAELALSGLEGAVGVALIAGTGSISLGRNAAGEKARAGGWGHLIGDEGSGYTIGRLAIQAAAQAADGRGMQTAILPAIMEAWSLTRPDGMIGHIYPDGDKGTIAALSGIVFTAARVGDRIAWQIMTGAATDLAITAIAVGDALGFKDRSLPLALAGGLLIHEADFRAMVLRRIRRRRRVGQIAIITDPALSAARAAIQLAEQSP